MKLKHGSLFMGWQDVQGDLRSSSNKVFDLQRMIKTKMKIPDRIQRKRTPGWKNPPNTLYCGRGSKYGNPVKSIANEIFIDISYLGIEQKWAYYSDGDIDDVLFIYNHLLNGTKFSNRHLKYWSYHFSYINFKYLLKYDHLSCWCPLDKPCHVDIIIKKLKEYEKR